MHRLILGIVDEPSQDCCVDHINGNRLDNRRNNLRIVTYSENAMNRHAILTSTGILRVSQYGDKYVARVRQHGTSVFIGSFSNADMAKEAVDQYLGTGEFPYTKRRIRPVIQRSLTGETIAIYANCQVASEKTGICAENINRVANKNRQRKQAGGFLWEFSEPT